MSTTKFRPLWGVVFLFLISPFASHSCWAEEYSNDTVYQRLYQQFVSLYSKEDTDTAFYIAAEELGNYYKTHNDLKRYYTTQLNICLYDTDRDMPFKALKRANEMLEEMEAGQTDAYENVYTALGTVYESRGSQNMARYYYEKALKCIDPKETRSLMSIQVRMAHLLVFNHPDEALALIEKVKEPSEAIPPYRQVYYTIKGIICFVTNDKKEFADIYSEYKAYRQKYTELDKFGLQVMDIIDKSFEGKYEEALAAVPGATYDLSNIGRQDMTILLCERMGRYDQALSESRKRAELIDSLNNEILINNINEINAQAGVNKAQLEASAARERTSIVFFSLSILIIITLLLLIRSSRKNKNMLTEKNDQLHSALAMAEEGEKMKLEFVRSVSHEIRTPLNAITGFNEILNSPAIELSMEERQDLTQRISDNVKAITTIVDEMLHMADKESNEFYPKETTIHPNQFFSAQLYKHRDKVSGAIELNYTTRVINRFEIMSNEEGLTKIMEQLIQNAIKFTSKGSITVHCELTDNDKKLQVSVTDTGRGISAEQREKIFEGFYKADVFDQGIGLGLTVSKKIARKLGGDLTLDESYNTGARFVLTLPVE